MPLLAKGSQLENIGLLIKQKRKRCMRRTNQVLLNFEIFSKLLHDCLVAIVAMRDFPTASDSNKPNHEQVGKHDPSNILLRKDKLKDESNDGKLKEGTGDRIHHLPLQSQPLHKRKRYRHRHHRRRRCRLQHATQKLRPEGRIVYLHVAVFLLPRIQIGKESKKMSRGTFSGRWRRKFMEASEQASLSREGSAA
ncbi:hypothetical protein M5K25_001084 [Dendrobium thyrsiflorum]|uniref:Uncharacterized protein n=1 Tax=Dendrobium thyrsiflorum TaxID=117978 RepID=A0ABD0WB72_DENTH